MLQATIYFDIKIYQNRPCWFAENCRVDSDAADWPAAAARWWHGAARGGTTSAGQGRERQHGIHPPLPGHSRVKLEVKTLM